jgi:hypothetical protein
VAEDTEGELRVHTNIKAVVAVLVAMVTLGTALPAGAGLLSDTTTSGSTSRYDDPFFLNWASYLPSTAPDTYLASTADVCKQGQDVCVDNVIREMTKRYNALGCDHDSTFAFTYLVTTEEYRRAIDDPAFFSDTAFINHQDALFADYYFDQFDDWHRGALADVSPAWRIAFHAAETQAVAGLGSVFLGMNAHINRDLPFVLAEIGLVKPDGTSRKPDHDRVNDFLAATNQYLLTDAAKYLDPTLDDVEIPGISIDNSTTVQVIVAWREQAWRNAERLVAAGSDAERAAVARQIEETAALEGKAILAALRYNPTHTLLGQDAAARNRFCGTHFQQR